MRNQKAERLVAAGLVLHIIQWIFILWAFLKVKHLFSDYTIYNLMSSAAPCSPYRLYK